MDNELFELCKEVYEKTGWSYEKNDKDLWFTRDEDGEIDTNSYIVDNCCWLETDEELVAPLYTSDYLLEKLQSLATRKWSNGLKGCEVSFFYDKDEGDWAARFKNTDKDDNKYFGDKPVGGVYGSVRFWENGDTPLKALLKLTLALKKAGVDL